MFPSMYMGGPWPFVVYLPPGYATSTRRYPVVYWFHGRGDNECTQVPLAANIQAAIQSGAAPPMIYVFLNGGAQCNFDDVSCPGKMAESYIMKELLPYVDAHYRTITAPLGRALEGFSMGAEGVLRYFYTYTDQFCDVMAYAPLARGTVPQTAQDKIKARGQVVMRIVVGTADAVHFGPCHQYDQLLTSLMIPHEYQEIPGVPHNPFMLWGSMGNMVGEKGLALHARCFAALGDLDGGSAGDAATSEDAAAEGAAEESGLPPSSGAGDSESPASEAGGSPPAEASATPGSGSAASSGESSGTALGSGSASEADAGLTPIAPPSGGCSCATASSARWPANLGAGLLASGAIRTARARRRKNRHRE
jgi:predicted esterase